MKRTWTPEQIKLLTEKYSNSTPDELAILFPDKTKAAIKTKATILGLKKAVQRFRFTPEQIAEIKRDYATTLNQDLADRFGCTIHAVHNAGFRLGLKKDKEFIRQIAKDNFTEDHPARKHWIKKGTPPPNKGKKQKEYMSKEAIERTKVTRFKKGSLPHNTLEDNTITERKDKSGRIYKYIRIKLAKWVPYHRYLWEQYNGAIPKGYNIQFRDGDTLNCDIDNLYMISRSEQMKNENSASKNLPDSAVAVYLVGKRGKDKALVEEIKNNHPELIELKRTQILLNRKIKEQNESN